ncbi:hypothetical protein EUZ85_17840 [Hahella sp. KA22]|uniref:hypothetical protein n=1 Tax=Hahella sp. KA22 TaxID=1628392 RepID=UPI000FDD68AA|nr:hypothetical protein [Hahella sp. KA22]AZZ92480.1 hypothetical protein ENC22_15265 [Hahella sp. KA22]QAY55854.1 hypothetical protein EUZ85_17840 [Hahella sp. KA22]
MTIIKNVAMGCTTALKTAGAAKTTLCSGELTVCTAFIFKVKDTQNATIGVGMSHRGVESANSFQKAFKESIRQFGDSVHIEPVAVQTAPSTFIGHSKAGADPSIELGSHECTIDALINDLETLKSDKKIIIDLSPLRSMACTAAKKDFATSECSATFDSKGDVKVSEPAAGLCVIL